MITTCSTTTRYKTHFTDGSHRAISDTTEDKGGSNTGIRPHDLLEAALANCMNMWIKMYADNHEIPLEEVKTRVSLDRSNPEEVIFGYSIELNGNLSVDQQRKLKQIATTCPVKKTLSKRIAFEKLHE
jgi:putative redox protein